MRFHTAAAEKLRITSDGNVGINTTTPNAPLEIQGAGGVNDSRITFTRHGTPSNNSVVGELSYRIGTDSVAGMGAYRESAIDDAYLAFYTQPTSGSYAERLRITSDGKIGIGNTTSPTADLEIAGRIGTATTVFINAPTHSSSKISEAALKFGYSHSGSPEAL